MCRSEARYDRRVAGDMGPVRGRASGIAHQAINSRMAASVVASVRSIRRTDPGRSSEAFQFALVEPGAAASISGRPHFGARHAKNLAIALSAVVCARFVLDVVAALWRRLSIRSRTSTGRPAWAALDAGTPVE